MISKEGLTVLIQLVNLAQKRGAYNLEESYLAFMVLKDVIDDPKYKRAVEAVKELFPENVTNKDENNNGLKGIIICSVSGIIWAITEAICNKYLLFGHAVWHIGMSTGMCYKINYFNSIRTVVLKKT